MQAEHLSDELLQRHYDGDLDRGEAARADAHLHGCKQCSAKRAGLAKLSQLIALEAGAADDVPSFAGMFERIERGIQQESEQNAGARVVPISSRRRRSLGTVSAVVGSFAVAAAVVLMVYRPGHEGNALPDGPLPGDGSSMPATAAPAPAATGTAANVPAHSEVVQVDFGSNAGTVFDIALADGSSTPVIWINDDE